MSDWRSDVCSSDLAHRFDAVDARAFGRIPLAAQDHLAVAGLEMELEFAVGALADLELAGHACPLDSVDEDRILQACQLGNRYPPKRAATSSRRGIAIEIVCASCRDRVGQYLCIPVVAG